MTLHNSSLLEMTHPVVYQVSPEPPAAAATSMLVATTKVKALSTTFIIPHSRQKPLKWYDIF